MSDDESTGEAGSDAGAGVHPGDAARRVFLADHDFPCPGCGYNLRNLTGDACPECHQQLEVELRLAEPHHGAYVGAMVGAAAGAGASGLFLLLLVMGTLMYGGGPGAGYMIVFGVALLASCAALERLARLAGRRRFRTASDGWRVVVLFACWIPFAAVLLTMVATLIDS